LVRHVLWLPHGYRGPRRDGRLVSDGTVEERGFDTILTAGGLFALIEGAWRAVPAIQELPIAESWVGFRPGSRDDAPMLGPSGIDRLVIATGHHRNGILLTPATAAVISAYIMTGRLPEIARPTSPERSAAADTSSRRARYLSQQVMLDALEASAAELVTASVRRISLEGYSGSLVELLGDRYRILPNTAGCVTARDAILTAELAREALETNWVKLELIGDRELLYPDVEQLVHAADELVRKGFIVLPYCNEDPVSCQKLADVGCAAVM